MELLAYLFAYGFVILLPTTIYAALGVVPVILIDIDTDWVIPVENISYETDEDKFHALFIRFRSIVCCVFWPLVSGYLLCRFLFNITREQTKVLAGATRHAVKLTGSKVRELTTRPPKTIVDHENSMLGAVSIPDERVGSLMLSQTPSRAVSTTNHQLILERTCEHCGFVNAVYEPWPSFVCCKCNEMSYPAQMVVKKLMNETAYKEGRINTFGRDGKPTTSKIADPNIIGSCACGEGNTRLQYAPTHKRYVCNVCCSMLDTL